MNIRTLLGKSYTLTKFKVNTDNLILLDTLAQNLDTMAFQELEGAYEKVAGFVTVEDAYAERPMFTVENISFAQDTFAVFAYRYDIKAVDSSAMKRKVERAEKERLEAFRKVEGSSRKFLTKDEKVDIKTKIKLEMLVQMSAKTKLIPIIFNRDEKVGYLFTQSAKAVGEILEELQAVFNEFEAVIEVEASYDSNEDFAVNWQEMLTWFWWQNEANGFLEIGSKKTFMGEDIELGFLSDKKKIVAKGASDNVRTAVAEGAVVTKALIETDDMTGEEIKFVLGFNLNYAGEPSNIKFKEHRAFEVLHEEDDTFLLDLYATFNAIYQYCKDVAEAYKKAYENGQIVNQSVRETWGRGDFCTKSFEDI